MIESISTSKSDGYTITLKPLYTNDFTNSRIIHVEKANTLQDDNERIA